MLREQASCQDHVNSFKRLTSLYEDSEVSLELAQESDDQDLLEETGRALAELETELARLEFMSKMSGEFDRANAILEVNSGAGGTEAQDWAEMILRMYLRWAENKNFKVEELDYQPGEGAGLKGATVLIQGEYAYGFLHPEQGVHRLVRISPFDSNQRRHTSFASVSVTPEIEQEIEVELDEDKDLRIDTYRASGKGGQHVNKTDSAVRLTHIPTGLVAACQSERSQHKNKERAMKMLKAKLYELERQKQAEKMDEIKGERKKIDFGSQIRSYVMHPYQMVKDLRTNFETSQVDAVLNGDIDQFIEAYLMA